MPVCFSLQPLHKRKEAAKAAKEKSEASSSNADGKSEDDTTDTGNVSTTSGATADTQLQVEIKQDYRKLQVCLIHKHITTFYNKFIIRL